MKIADTARPATQSINTIHSHEPHTVIDIDSLEEALRRIDQEIPTEQRAPLSPQDMEFALSSVEGAIRMIIEERNDTERTIPLLDHIALLIEDPGSYAPNTTSGLERGLLACLEDLKGSLEPDRFLSRAQQVLAYLSEQLGKLARNEFEGDFGRWAGNVTHSVLRTGLVTAILTVVRQLIGFALEKLLQSNAASPLTRNVIGSIVQMIGPLLNVLGAVRDECNGTANRETRLARLLTLVISGLAFAAAATVPSALPALASFGSQMAFYTFAQDLVSLFCPAGDNAKANLGGTAVAGLINGILQFLSFTAMNYTAPRSGPGYVMGQGNKPSSSEGEGLASQLMAWMAQQEANASDVDLAPEARVSQMLESLDPLLQHDLSRGAYNSGADVLGQLFMGEAMHALQANPSEKGYRVNPVTVRLPTAEQIGNQLLSTNAIRTSVGQVIMAVVISASRYFSELVDKRTADHIANFLVAAVVFALRPSSTYINERNPKTV
ncbi:hypothetical protein [Pseudomonas sp. SMN5]|uniref:hypothetical protein n=1 Tax=Pseudomonas sp. SMN5 TaxID=3390198 RepID=UPI003F86EEEF